MSVSYKVSREPGNTPLKHWPEDYVPGGKQNARWLTLQKGPDAGKKLFYYDVTLGTEEPDKTLLFVHGNPESSYTYAKTIAELQNRTDVNVRVVAMDHIGFGLSDQASFEMVDFHHAHNLQQLIEHLDLNNICLLIHDWGGAIGIGSLIDQAERVKALLIMNTTVFPIARDGKWVYDNFPFPGVLSWNKLAAWFPNKLWPYLCSMIVCRPIYSSPGFALESFRFSIRAMFGKLNQQETLYRDMFNSDINSRSSRRNARQTHRWGYGYQYHDPLVGEQDNSKFYQNIQGKISKLWGGKIPALGFFGQWDVLAKPSVLQQWCAHLPQLEDRISLYPKRGHFIEEWEYVDIANGVVSLLNDMRSGHFGNGD
ncbi:alpha/beta fold hydrolase [Pseudoteredinibacter isoporae]|uniref:Pimeloyl-ACP methyl ester carboxylesterase n=1 Tax=Pseudoteredinibacter isoporae TaxID=570281 RepID=A0A7X0JR54_9GAMM|nr:alpha/beta fold hydrolase [Pseudoteredinibacter isoporae]MBB6519835.1 pimeloyl-ACP methyl ester carboxylesterase [Pseudoteredinibacter isoporae]NHO85414.1 alpha/beta fold hydrolase [Pseudoteredinibacter isoporae]NIB26134.1 alpha/beta fold hydrolase [Pseudoteredinibacter isoporae]